MSWHSFQKLNKPGLKYWEWFVRFPCIWRLDQSFLRYCRPEIASSICFFSRYSQQIKRSENKRCHMSISGNWAQTIGLLGQVPGFLHTGSTMCDRHQKMRSFWPEGKEALKLSLRLWNVGHLLFDFYIEWSFLQLVGFWTLQVCWKKKKKIKIQFFFFFVLSEGQNVRLSYKQEIGNLSRKFVNFFTGQCVTGWLF